MIAVYSHKYTSPKWQAYVTPEEDAFDFGNGERVRSLLELKEALANLPEDVIERHVVPENHIAQWVRDKVGDEKLSDVLEDQKHRWGLVVALERQMMRTMNLPHYLAQRWLSESRYPFGFKDGQEVKSLEELANVLDSVSDETVQFHMERSPNDIAKWVHDVVGDYELAENLAEAQHREQMHRMVVDHLEMLHEVANADH